MVIFLMRGKIAKNRTLWRSSRPPRAKAKIDQLIKMCDDTSMHKSKVLNMYLGMGEGEIFFLQYPKLVICQISICEKSP